MSQTTTPAAPVRISWKRNLFFVVLAQTTMVVCFSFVFPFSPLFVQDLGVTDQGEAAFWTGLAGGAMGLALFLGAPVWGIVGDRYGRKLNVMRAIVGAAAATFITSFAPNVQTFILLRFVAGLFTGVFPASQALIASQAPRDRMAFSMGMIQLSGFIGNSFGPLMGGTLADLVGYRDTFRAAGGIMLLAAILVFLFVREDFQKPVDAEKRSPLDHFKGFFEMATSAQFLPLLALLFVIQMAPVITGPILPLFVRELAPDVEPGKATGLAFGVMGVTSAVSAILLSRVADRIGPQRIMVVCALIVGVLYVPLSQARDLWQLIGIMALVGFFNGGLFSTTGALVALLAGKGKTGQAFGAAQSANSTAMTIGPITGGVLANAVGLRGVFLANAGMFLVSAVFARRMLGKRRPEPEVTTS